MQSKRNANNGEDQGRMSKLIAYYKLQSVTCIFLAFLGIVWGLNQAMCEMKDKAQKMDELFQEFTGDNVPGASVMVIHNADIVFQKGYGLADLEKKSRCTAETNFRLASVTKQFTSMAILMLQERHALALTDPITKFFPEFPDYGKKITIRHLLTHTSGLIDYEDLISDGTTLQLSDRDVLQLVRKQNQTYFAPGEKFRYSNTGYAFLALIVEAASGITFPQFLKRYIFDPLKMSNTVAYVAGISAVPNRAFGYAKEENEFVPSDQSLTSAVLGDGGIYSSLHDLYLWDQALYTEKLVSTKSLNEAFTAASISSDMPESGYGFGWYIGKYRDSPHLWHYGGTCGFSTRLERFPKQKFTVIVLTNRRDANLDHIGEKVADVFLNTR
jgi:CubicO group peptidase (beta-lactamase class C family)